jgi:integrase
VRSTTYRGRASYRPSAADVTAVLERIPAKHRLALIWLDWSGARVSSVDHLRVGDYDESRRRVRLRAATTKTRRALWIELHPVLAEAIEATLPHRRFRDPEARLFADSGSDALRTAIGKACKAAGIPLWSPHDLRHRRISLLHLRGVPWARIGEFVGQRDLTVTANTYTHVVVDEAEVDYAALLGDRRVGSARTVRSRRSEKLALCRVGPDPTRGVIESPRNALLRSTSLQEIRPGSASLSLSVTCLLSRVP